MKLNRCHAKLNALTFRRSRREWVPCEALRMSWLGQPQFRVREIGPVVIQSRPGIVPRARPASLELARHVFQEVDHGPLLARGKPGGDLLRPRPELGDHGAVQPVSVIQIQSEDQEGRKVIDETVESQKEDVLARHPGLHLIQRDLSPAPAVEELPDRFGLAPFTAGPAQDDRLVPGMGARGESRLDLLAQRFDRPRHRKPFAEWVPCEALSFRALEKVIPDARKIVILRRDVVVTELGEERLAGEDLVEAVAEHRIDVEEDLVLRRGAVNRREQALQLGLTDRPHAPELEPLVGEEKGIGAGSVTEKTWQVAHSPVRDS